MNPPNHPASRPKPIVVPHIVPLRGRFEEPPVPRHKVLLDHIQIEFEAETRSFGHRDVAVLDNRFRWAVDEVAPVGDFVEVVFEGDELLR